MYKQMAIWGYAVVGIRRSPRGQHAEGVLLAAALPALRRRARFASLACDRPPHGTRHDTPHPGYPTASSRGSNFQPLPACYTSPCFPSSPLPSALPASASFVGNDVVLANVAFVSERSTVSGEAIEETGLTQQSDIGLTAMHHITDMERLTIRRHGQLPLERLPPCRVGDFGW